MFASHIFYSLHNMCTVLAVIIKLRPKVYFLSLCNYPTYILYNDNVFICNRLDVLLCRDVPLLGFTLVPFW